MDNIFCAWLKGLEDIDDVSKEVVSLDVVKIVVGEVISKTSESRKLNNKK